MSTHTRATTHIIPIFTYPLPRSSNAAIDPTEDSRLMFQFVSSALAYPPPPMLAPGTVALTDHRFAYDEDTGEGV